MGDAKCTESLVGRELDAWLSGLAVGGIGRANECMWLLRYHLKDDLPSVLKTPAMERLQ